MSGGVPQRPAALRLLNGRTPDTDSGGRRVAPPANFARVAPEVPGWLSDEAAAEWRRIIPELTRMKLIKEVDRATLSAYCESWSRFVEISKSWHAGDARTSLVENASKELRQWAREFGLTPSAEGAVRPPELPDGDDPFA
jgi:phage terminase small subunit